nr:uroporphyrinogen-III C-methyltransferase [Leptothrix sp. C29]
MPLGLVLALLAAGGAWTSWQTQQRVHSLEMELVKRQQGSSEQSSEARVLARQADEVARDAAAKVALMEARVSEVALQRGQIDELLQSLSRSRDENAVSDIDAAVRVALQQSTLTGSAEPLMVALRSADERLARLSQPRLEPLRRAIARDMDRVRSVAVPDIGSLLIKLDESVRLADELPLVSQSATSGRAVAAAQQARAAAPAARASMSAEGASSVWPQWLLDWDVPLQRVWTEIGSLLRVTRIDHPEAMLLSPEQGFFLRENLKLRLLNARLSLLSRQPEAASADLQAAQRSLVTYFDMGARRTQIAAELLRQVASQSRLVGIPRPDDTLAATAAALAGR